jgi:hypothetical protein
VPIEPDRSTDDDDGFMLVYAVERDGRTHRFYLSKTEAIKCARIVATKGKSTVLVEAYAVADEDMASTDLLRTIVHFLNHEPAGVMRYKTVWRDWGDDDDDDDDDGGQRPKTPAPPEPAHA